MKGFFGLINKYTKINKWLASITLTVMMGIVVFCATAREFNHPIVGDVEIVQLAMVAVIVGALSYAQSEKAHIAIGIIADKLPIKIQHFLDLVSGVFILLFSALVVYVFVIKMSFAQTSLLLGVPFFYFKIMLIIGFVGWGLEAVKLIVESLQGLLAESKGPFQEHVQAMPETKIKAESVNQQ